MVESELVALPTYIMTWGDEAAVRDAVPDGGCDNHDHRGERGPQEVGSTWHW